MNVASATWRRSRGVLLLAFAVALAAGVLVTSGATVLARARVQAAPPAEGRYYVVARGPLAEATRAGLEAHGDAAIVAEHGIDDLLGETAALRTGGETMRVLEVRMARRPGEDAATEVATLQQLEGVVDVIALAPPQPPAPPAGQGIVGGALVALGCVIRGETYHFEIVANESSRGLMNLTIDGIAVESRLAKEGRFDSDLWIIEVEDREGRHFLDTYLD